MSKQIMTPAALMAGATLVGSLSVANLAQAGDNPFVTEQLESGYLQLAEGSCGEGKCGAVPRMAARASVARASAAAVKAISVKVHTSLLVFSLAFFVAAPVT